MECHFYNVLGDFLLLICHKFELELVIILEYNQCKMLLLVAEIFSVYFVLRAILCERYNVKFLFSFFFLNRVELLNPVRKSFRK